MVARGFAGQLLDIGRRHNVPLEALMGVSHRRLEVSTDRPDAFGQTKRLYMLLTLMNLGPRGILRTDLTRRYAEPYEIGIGMLRGQTDSFEEASLVCVERAAKNEKRFIPTPKLRELADDFRNLIVRVIQRDGDVISEGNQRMDHLLTQKDILPYLVRRALGQADNERFPVAARAQVLAERILKEAGVALTTRELFDACEDEFDGSFGAFSAALRAVPRFTKPTIEPRDQLQGRPTRWQLKTNSNGNSTAAPRY